MIGANNIIDSLTTPSVKKFLEYTREKFTCIHLPLFGEKVWQLPRALKPLRSFSKRFLHIREVDDTRFKEILISSLRPLTASSSASAEVKKLAHRQIIILSALEVDSTPLLLPSRLPSKEALCANKLKEEALIRHSLLNDLNYDTHLAPTHSVLSRAFSGDYPEELLTHLNSSSEEKKALLKAARVITKITDGIVQLGKTNLDAAKKQLNRLSIDLASQCVDLDDGDSCLLPFEIISKNNLIKEGASSYLPKEMLTLLDDTPDIDSLISKLHQQMTIKFSLDFLTPSESTTLFNLLERGLYSQLPQSLQDKIPEFIKKRLPTFFTGNLQSLIITPLQSILSVDEMNEFQAHISTYGLKDALIHKATPFIQSALKMKNHITESAFSTLYANMPSMAADVLAFQGLSPTKQRLFFQCTKQGTAVDITLFSTNVSRGLVNDGDEVKTVFTFKSVPIEKVNQDFFLNALTFKAFPAWDLCELTSFDFYETCLSPLSKYLEPSTTTPNITPLLLKEPSNSDFLTSNYLLHDQFDSCDELYLAKFKMRFDYLLASARDQQSLSAPLCIEYKSYTDSLLSEIDSIHLYTSQEKCAIKATLCDIMRKFHLTKGETAPLKLPKALSLLPPMIHSTLGMMLREFGYSEDQLLIIRDTFSESFGSEYAPFFDSALRELADSIKLSKRNSSPSTPLINLDETFTANVCRLSHKIYEEVTNQLFITSFTILSMLINYGALSFAAIPWMVLQAVGIRYHQVILRQILPIEIYEIYVNLMTQAQSSLIALFARIFASHFFSKEDQEDIKRSIDRFLQAAFPLSAKNFSVKPPTQPISENLSTTHTFPSDAGSFPSQIDEDAPLLTSHYERHYSTEIQTLQDLALSEEPLLKQTGRISAIKFIESTLSECQLLLSEDLHQEAALLAMKALQAIPTPIKSVDPFFDQFKTEEESDQFLQLIIDLSFHAKNYRTGEPSAAEKKRDIAQSDKYLSPIVRMIQEALSKINLDPLSVIFTKKAEPSPSRESLFKRFPPYTQHFLSDDVHVTTFNSYEMRSSSTLTAWHSLAITEKLARKNVEELDESTRTNILEYRRWLESDSALFLSPQEHLVLDKVCDYYEIDRSKINTEDALIKEYEGALFSNPVGEQLLTNRDSTPGFMTPRGSITLESYETATNRLYKRLAQRKHFHTKIAHLNLSEEEALCYLITNGYVDAEITTENINVLPFSIVALREMTSRLPRFTTHASVSTKPISRMIQIPTWKKYTTDLEPPLIYMSEAKKRTKHTLLDHLINTPVRRVNEGASIYSGGLRIMNSPFSNDENILLHSVSSNKYDQVSRALSFLKENESLHYDTYATNISLLCTLLQGGALHLQLQKQPELAHDIASLFTIPFLQSLFTDTTKHNNAMNNNYAIELLDKIRAVSIFHCPESTTAFDSLLLNMSTIALSTPSLSSKTTTNLLLQFLVNYPDLNPDTITDPLLKQHLIRVLANICFNQGAGLLQPSSYAASLIHQATITFKRWESVLIEALNHDFVLISDVATHVTKGEANVVLPQDPSQWSGSFPLFRCETLILDFSQGSFTPLYQDQSSLFKKLIHTFDPSSIPSRLIQHDLFTFYDDINDLTYVFSDKLPPSLHVEKDFNGTTYHKVITKPNFPGIDLSDFEIWQSGLKTQEILLIREGITAAEITTKDTDGILIISSIKIINHEIIDSSRLSINPADTSLNLLFIERGFTPTFFSSLDDLSKLDQIRLGDVLTLSIQHNKAICMNTPSLEGFELSQSPCAMAEKAMPDAIHFTSLQDPNQRKLLISNSNPIISTVKGVLKRFVPSLHSKFSTPLIRHLLSSIDSNKPQQMLFSFDPKEGVSSESVDALIYLLLHALSEGNDQKIDLLSKKLNSILRKDNELSPFAKSSLSLINMISLADQKYLPLAIRLNLLAQETAILRDDHLPSNEPFHHQLFTVASSIALFYTWKQNNMTSIFPLTELEEYDFLRTLKHKIGALASLHLDLNPVAPDSIKSKAINLAKDEMKESLWSCLLPMHILSQYMKSEMKYEGLSQLQVLIRHKMRFIFEMENSPVSATIFGSVSSGLSYFSDKVFAAGDSLLGSKAKTFGIDKRTSLPIQLMTLQKDSNKLYTDPAIVELFSMAKQGRIQPFNLAISTDFIDLSEEQLTEHFYDYYRLAFNQPPKEIQDNAHQLDLFHQMSIDFRYSMQRFTGTSSKALTFFTKLFGAKTSSAPQLDALILSFTCLENTSSYSVMEVGEAKIKKWNQSAIALTEGNFSNYCSLTYHHALKPFASFVATQIGIKKLFSSVTGLDGFFPGAVVHLSMKAYNIGSTFIRMNRSSPDKARQTTLRSTYTLDHIDQFDRHLEDQCQTLHRRFFVVQTTKRSDMRVADNLSESHKEDLTAFYRDNPNLQSHSFISDQDPHQLGVSIFTLQEKLHASIISREDQILNHINHHKRDSVRDVTIQVLDRIALANSPESTIKRITTLTDRDIDRLLQEYMLMKAEITRKTLLVNTLCLLEEALVTNNTIVKGEILHLVGERLLQKRGYRFSDPTYPEEVKQCLLHFEASSGFMLWSHQPLLVLKAYKDDGEVSHKTIEAIMGTGKSAVVIPLASKLLGGKADGTPRNSFTINIFPEAIFEEATNTLINTARDHLAQEVNKVVIDETTEINGRWLHSFYLLLLRCVSVGESLVMSKESLQSLESHFIKILHSQDGSTSDQYLEEYARVLNLIHTKAIFNVDEAHDAFYHGKELNIPLGKSLKLKDAYIDISALCMTTLYELTSIGAFLETLAQNNLSQENQKSLYEQVVKRELLLRLSEHKHFSFNEREQRDYIRFTEDNRSPLPFSLRDNPHLEDIMLSRGIVTQILPETITQVINVDFGTADGDIDFALPALGSHKPDISSRLINPFETLIKTFLATIYNGLSKRRIERFYDFLHKCANAEGSDSDSTPTERLFTKWFPGENLSTTSLKKFIALLEKKPAAPIIWYVQHSTAHQIKYFAHNIKSGSETFQTMARSVVSYTGSPYNVDTFHEKTKFYSDDTTTGRTLHELLESATLTTFDDATGFDFDFFIKSYLSSDLTIRAIIDLGAIFSLPGFSNEFLAGRIFEYIKSRTDLDGVVYFDSKCGNLLILEKGRTGPIPLSESNISVSRRLTFYDHVHRLAADVDQENGAKAIATIGKKTELQRDIAQGVWRMRGLGKDKKAQKIIFALSATLAATISPDHTCTVSDLIAFAAKTHEETSRQSNFAADTAKITMVIKRGLLSKLASQTRGSTIRSLFKEFSSLLIDPFQDSPSSLYGGVQSSRDPLKIFIEMKRAAIGLVLRSRSFSIDEKQDLQVEIETIGTDSTKYPDLIDETSDSKPHLTYFGSSQKLNVAQTQNINSIEVIENEQVEKMANQMTLQLSIQPAKVKPLSVKAFSWAEDFDIHDTSRWLQFSTIKKQGRLSYLLGIIPEHTGNSGMALYTMKEVLRENGSEHLQSLAPLFSAVNVFMSHNFAPITHSRYDLLGVFRKPMQEVLVVSTMDEYGHEKITLGLLDSADLDTWHRKIALGHPHGTTKIAIYNPLLKRVIETTDPSFSSTVISTNSEITDTLITLNLLFAKKCATVEEEAQLGTFLEKHPAHLNAFFDVWQESHDSRHSKSAESTRIFSVFHRLKEAAKEKNLQQKVSKAFRRAHQRQQRQPPLIIRWAFKIVRSHKLLAILKIA